MNVNRPVGMMPAQQPQFGGLWDKTKAKAKETAKEHPYATATAAGAAAIALTPITLFSFLGAALIAGPAAVKGAKSVAENGVENTKEALEDKASDVVDKFKNRK